jgi:SAM-dependent methyltransferase
MANFGERRLVREKYGFAEKSLFKLMGVPDPAHYLHNRYLRRELRGLQGLNPKKILDAGCGSADHTFYLARCYPQADVLGVDLNAPQIERNAEMARRLGISNVKFEVADLSAAKFPHHFDLVISIDVLEHIPRQTEAIANLSFALAPGGAAFFHIPTVRERPVPFSRWLTGFHAWAEKEHIADERTADEFVEIVRSSGLEIMKAYRTFGYYTGELATSLFAMPYAPTTFNRLALAMLMVPCRIFALADTLNLEKTRYAVAVVCRKSA